MIIVAAFPFANVVEKVRRVRVKMDYRVPDHVGAQSKDGRPRLFCAGMELEIETVP